MSQSAGAKGAVIWTMAIASGATVANLYYNQPLLPEIARTFSASDHAVGLIPTVTQIGYGLGMLLIVPLGDSSERRKLILTLIGLVPVAASLAPPDQRGRAVGIVMSGLLFGVLLSRTVAGVVGEALGWRAVYL